MPSPAALERGSRVAQGIIEAHQAANDGAFPETVAVRVDVGHFCVSLPFVCKNPK